jgi:type IV pilus assembly protein PilA
MFSNKGFTLIELMIVVVIIGILAAIFIPNFISMEDRARDATVKNSGHTTQLAVEDYGVQNNGTYPSMETASVGITANLPGGVSFANPFGGQYGLLVATETADMFNDRESGPEGTVVYYPPAPGSKMYIIACYGKSGVFILKLSNG